MAEELAAAHMRSIGYLDARRTPSGTDAGVDVAAANAIAQVKYHAQAIGGPDIQRLRGAAFNHADALFYSSSGYTSAAVIAAELSGVALFRYSTSNEVTPVNARAIELESGFDLPAGITLENIEIAVDAVRSANALARANRAVGGALEEMVTEIASGQFPPYEGVEDDLKSLHSDGLYLWEHLQRSGGSRRLQPDVEDEQRMGGGASKLAQDHPRGQSRSRLTYGQDSESVQRRERN
jgi:hypothetical protein